MADHWRAPRDMRPVYIRFVQIARGAIVGPLVAILFVVAVIWLAKAGEFRYAPNPYTVYCLVPDRPGDYESFCENTRERGDIPPNRLRVDFYHRTWYWI